MTKTPKPRCGAKTRAGGSCQQWRGMRTDHLGLGNCWLHGGRTPNGKAHAETEAAELAVAKLGLPMGTGDPFDLLEATTKHARGRLEAAARIVNDVVDKKRDDVTLAAADGMYAEAIRQGAQTGHQAVTANVADRQAKISEQLAGVVMAAVQNGISAYAAAIAGGKTPSEALGLGEAAAADILEVRVPAGAGLN